MNLNELFFRHQIALMRADGADDCGERRRLGTLADDLAARIGAVVHSLGGRAMPPPPAALRGCAL